MRKQTRKTPLIIVTLLLIAISTMYITGTYAKYTSTLEATANATIASWSIDLTDGTESVLDGELTFTVNDNDHVATGKFAPTSTATAEFYLDPEGTDVSVEYEVTLGDLTSSGSADIPDDLTISSVKYYDGSAWVALSENKGQILLKDNATLSTDDKVQLQVTVEWVGADNATDTLLGIEAPTLSIPVTVVATQYTGN